MRTVPSTAPRRAVTSQLLSPPRPSMARLVWVELRKSLDTRASRWLVAALALLIVAAAIYSVADGPNDGPVAAVRFFSTPWVVVRMLLPVLGVLSMTSEWSQRTALTTFALVPRRGRVLAAKLGAAIGTAVATVLLTVLVATIVAAVAGPITGQPVQWHGFVRHIAGALVGGVCFIGLGAGLGVLLQQTASALVAYFIAPTLVTVVGTALVDQGVYWIAPTVAIGRVDDLDLSGVVAPTVVALVLWILVPLTVGSVRWLRREVP